MPRVVFCFLFFVVPLSITQTRAKSTYPCTNKSRKTLTEMQTVGSRQRAVRPLNINVLRVKCSKNTWKCNQMDPWLYTPTLSIIDEVVNVNSAHPPPHVLNQYLSSGHTVTAATITAAKTNLYDRRFMGAIARPWCVITHCAIITTWEMLGRAARQTSARCRGLSNTKEMTYSSYSNKRTQVTWR